MKKIKLIGVRKRKEFSQQQIADYLCMDVSNYNRREKGKIKITQDEWLKLTSIFDVSMEEIFESEDGNTVNTGNYNGEMYSIPIFVLENQQKYIQKLEEEILRLKEKKSEMKQL